VRFLYHFFIQAFAFAISIAALWNRKAAQWKRGRRNLWHELEQTFSKPHTVIWIHAASAGEFEQAKPVIEALKNGFPQHQILVTFFSPSGYPAGKKFALADYVFYLPLDTKKNAGKFINLIQPKLVVFVKYDFWYHHLKAVLDRNIPLLLISSIFRKEQVFFKWYGSFYLNMLRFFTHLFVQDETSYELLKKFDIVNCSVAGDTRFDRVLTIAKSFNPIPVIDAFCSDNKVIVAGSTWPDDEQLLQAAFKKFASTKMIIAPHEINDTHLKSITELFQNTILYSALEKAAEEEQQRMQQQATVLVIDTMGLLSRLYYYATVAYIGGGFNKSGIHNTLEAAVFGKPVLFGPNYKKFREARELIKSGGARSYATEQDLEDTLRNWFMHPEVLEKTGDAAGKYVQANSGATEKIIRFIQEKRLLTN
jgi:3-deoxy-D-manno-octulosonic-acid transferase